MKKTAVIRDGNGDPCGTVQLGFAVECLAAAALVGAATAILGIPLLAWKVAIGGDETVVLKKRVAVIEQNIGKLDETARDTEQDARHANKKLDKILDAMKLPRVPEPEKKKSELKAAPHE